VYQQLSDYLPDYASFDDILDALMARSIESSALVQHYNYQNKKPVVKAPTEEVKKP